METKEILLKIITTIIVILLVGYVGLLYGKSIDCKKCQIGLPNFFKTEDIDKCFVCWMPTYCPIKEGT